jgi:ABC-type uncharacterized transport system permease subunit
LLLVAYFILILGQFLEGFYDKNMVNFEHISRNIFNMFTIVMFIIVLWRHYQKDACLAFHI